MNADQPKKIKHSWKKGSYGKVVSLNALCQIMMGPRRYKKSRVNCVALVCMPNALQLFLSTTRRVSSTIKAHHFTEHGNISPWRFSWFCSFWPSLPKVRKIKFFGFAVFLVLQLRFFFPLHSHWNYHKCQRCCCPLRSQNPGSQRISYWRPSGSRPRPTWSTSRFGKGDFGSFVERPIWLHQKTHLWITCSTFPTTSSKYISSTYVTHWPIAQFLSKNKILVKR